MTVKTYAKTLDGLAEAIKDAAPAVRSVTWTSFGDAGAIAKLTLKWWAWLTFGVSHAVTLRQTREAVEKYKPLGMIILFDSW